MTIKAIETKYKGYRFRSRLEARWAVFFDAAGIAWEYEKEGYDLGGGLGGYLPDFWLPQVQMWAEVKPTAFSDIEIAKCFELAKVTGHPCLMLDGVPDATNYYAIHPVRVFEDTNGIASFIDDVFLNSRYLREGRFYTNTGVGYPNRQYNYGCEDRDAIEAARSARFEHGETPQQRRVEPPAPQWIISSPLPRQTVTTIVTKQHTGGKSSWLAEIGNRYFGRPLRSDVNDG